MRIGFDFRPAQRKNSWRRGIGRYTRELVTALLDVNREFEFTLYSLRGEPLDVNSNSTRYISQLRRPKRLNWMLDWCLLPEYFRKDRLNLFHCPDVISVPREGSVPICVTIHDVIPLVFWEEFVRAEPRDYSYALRRAFGRSAKCRLILTDSEHTRLDVLERLDVPDSRVYVLYPGSPKRLHPVGIEVAREWLKLHYGIERPFVFYLGGTDSRKNLARLVRAFSRLRQRGYEGLLVLGGETFNWNLKEVVNLRRSVVVEGVEADVQFPGFIPDEELVYFFSACDFFAFPSLYEGFGLPVVEAMKCGSPVLTSNRSSLPEIAGDAALLCDPDSEDEILAGMERLLSDSQLQSELRTKGPQRALRFDWKTSAHQLLSLYRTVQQDG